MRSKRARSYSEWSEEIVVDAVPIDLERVTDDETQDYDARLVTEVDVSDEVLIIGQLRVEGTTPIEIKTCQVWIEATGSNGDRRRGRFKIFDHAHEQLCELGGAYLLVLLDDDEVVAHVLVTASVLDLYLDDRWTNNGYDSHRQGREQIAQLNWAVVFDPEHIQEGQS